METTVLLEEIRERNVGDFLQEVMREHERLRVILESGAMIMIEPAGVQDRLLTETITALAPLPILQGFVPDGWKDAVYDIG